MHVGLLFLYGCGCGLLFCAVVGGIVLLMVSGEVSRWRENFPAQPLVGLPDLGGPPSRPSDEQGVPPLRSTGALTSPLDNWRSPAIRNPEDT